MTKRRKNHDEQRRPNQQDDDFIPVPIQTFLWRQTSPFVRPYLGKARDMAQIEQRDACKLFERVIITNNIWGQSPSLTDAIASIDRWRLIKVSFPFVLQCTAALLNNKLIKDHNFNRLGGNEAKMMYTLQWILMNASEECADSENEAKANANNVAIVAATAASLLKPTQNQNATCQQQQQQLNQGSSSTATSTHIDQRHQNLQAQQLSSSAQTTNTSACPPLSSATLGGSTSSYANQSIIIPAANAAASVVAVAAPSGMSTLQMQTTLPSSSSVSPIGSSTPTKPLTPTNPPATSCPSNYLLPIYSIHMFVYHFAPMMESLKHSDFLTSNQRLEIGAALWEPLFNHQLPNIQCLIAQVKPQKDRNSSSSMAFFSRSTNQQHEIVFPTSAGVPSDRRRSSSMIQESQFGDVFLGSPPTNTTIINDTCSKNSAHPMIDTKIKRTEVNNEHNNHRKTNITTSGTNFSVASQQHSDVDQFVSDTSYATHLDIAVLRCLFIPDWQESGVYWAITFLSNRMAELCYTDEIEVDSKVRPRSKSLSDIDEADLRDVSIKTDRLSDKIERKLSKQLPRVIMQKDESASVNDKQVRVKDDQTTTASSKLLKVEDADNFDMMDSSRDMKSPVRRLSFSSGMQTLANQIRKTSKRVKKLSDNQQTGDSVTSESQLSINQGQSMEGRGPPSSPYSHTRRSSSADDLTTIQISTLSHLHSNLLKEACEKNGQLTESNPVITVTTNANQLQQGKHESIKSQQHKQERSHQATGAKSERQFLMQRLYARSLKQLDRITRSQSIPKNMSFSPFETKKEQADHGESHGAAHYVDDHGRIDPMVVLKVLHSISQREQACSQRVCDRILSLTLKLIHLGIMKENFNFSRRSSQQKDLNKLLSTRQHVFKLLDNKSHVVNMDSDQRLIKQQFQKEALERSALIHKILIDMLFRLYHHLGCPNHCGMESTVEHHHQREQARLLSLSSKTVITNDPATAKNLRFKLRDTLNHLSRYNRENFIKYVQCLIKERTLQQVVDILHSILGFCRSDYIKNLDRYQQAGAMGTHGHSVQFVSTSSNPALNLQEQVRQTNQCGSTSSTHSDGLETARTNQGAKFAISQGTSQTTHASINLPKKNTETVENVIVMNSFKELVTRMASVNKELKLQENTSLYCDIRRLISFIRDNYGGVFRGIVLSALIDCAKIVNQQQRPVSIDLSSQKKMGDLTCPPSDDDSIGESGLSLKRGMKVLNEHSDADQNRMNVTSLIGGSFATMQQSPQAYGQDTSLMQHRTSIGSYRFHPSGHPKHSKQIAVLQSYSQQDQSHSQSTGILSLSSKAKKKFEQVFGGKPMKGTKQHPGHLGEDLNQSGSIVPNDCDQTVIDDVSRRASVAGYQSMTSFQENNCKTIPNNIQQLSLGTQLSQIQLLRQNQQILETVRLGMSNFSFLMESCAPGDFLDPALLAALLDLKSPIAVRAAIYLECANFVHRCNRGQWPSWMRMNVGGHRNSMSGNIQSGASRLRKSSSIQRTARNNTLMYRAAGRAFYSWAEAIGTRLEELISDENDCCRDKDSVIMEDTENDVSSEQGTMTGSQINDCQYNIDIDFYQPTLGGTTSPFALKMAACQLLFEVTTFLRETYRYLPPAIVHHHTAGSKTGDKMSSIYDVSRAVTANRRWSMALSSLGFGQLPATLTALSAGATSTQPNSSSQHLKNPSTTSIAEHPERRISFILHETNDENEQQNQQESAISAHADLSSSQAITSPIAPSVNTNEQQQDAMKKMTAGRHLSQSSASSAVVVAAATCLLRSSGVIDSQSHRRKSIKLRKTTQDRDRGDKKTKFAQDLDEENENSSISDAGMRRTDSLRSRRRVSGISERSDTSDRTNNPHTGCQDNGPPFGPELSGDESAGNGSCEDAYAADAAEKFEADESRIMSNMPWFKAIALVNSSIDRNCVHYPNCKQYCYKLHQNTCKRLVSCVQSIYQDSDEEQNYASSVFESRLANLINLGNQQRVSPQDFKSARTGSECSSHLQSNSEGEQKRKDKKSKKHQQQIDSLHDDSSYVSPRTKKQEKYDNRMQSMKSFHLDSIASGNGVNSAMMTDALKALTAAKAKKRATAQRNQEEPLIVKYIKGNVKSLLHCPMSSFLKGAVILPRDTFVEMIKFSWSLLLEDDQQLSRTAAVGFIIASIKCPTEASKLLLDELECDDASRKIAAINKFYVIWDARYQCWPRLEDGAFVHFKMAPPSIEFTLPSPKIAQESKPVVDPPWMPRKTSNVEEVTIGQDQSVQKSFVTATKTRRKQQIEILTKALREKHDKLREDRENYHITSAPITLYAAFEPTLSNQSGGGDEMDGTNNDEDTQQENRALLQMKTAQALFPTCLCQAAIVMINLLDDSRVTYEGSAVYEVANKVIWSCLVEDPALFLRHFFERLTRQNQSTIFQVLRRLIRFMPRLPPQAAYTLYNYLIGFIIYYIRCPVESSQKLISDTLSVLCLVVPSVYGLFLKDLKQILRKEQCDHNLLITANVPSAKKIIVHGSDSSGIPSQFPIDESTQFYHILVDSLEFFGIEKPKQNEYFLIDVRTNYMHNLHSYVRDYYSFKRSQHPQLQLINMNPDRAFDILQRQELINQFLEFGKVSMSLSIVKSSYMAVQRVLFLHEELMKLPTFPRTALMTNFSLFRGPLGHQVFSMDRIHKICWVQVIARMFELTSGFFLQLGDIHLFLNAISGIFVLHCEEASVSRLCLATFINATYQFKNIFAIDGFMPMMATIVQVYSNHQNNQLLCRSIEFVCKQFYIMHRKPFLLQLFGSVASKLNTAEVIHQNQANYPLASNQPNHLSGQPINNFMVSDPNRISPVAFFRLLQSLEKAFKDPLDILELVEAEKPLRAIDFCYQQDKEAIEILDIISLCVTVTAYASESPRSTQMLIILENVVPLYMKYLQASTSKKAGQSMGKQAHKDELQKIQSISICIRTLIVNCEGLTRNFNGPLPSIDFRNSSIRRTGNKSSVAQQKGQNNSAGSPIDLYNDEPSYSGPEKSKRDIGPGHAAAKNASIGGPYKTSKRFSNDESEITRGEFIVPRDTLLNLVAEFLSLSTGRLVESAKKYVELHQKHSSYELLDIKSHLRLAEVANSLLKFASTDPSVMACRGLIRYMNEILPNTEWRQEAIRPALIMILKRLDKTFNRIAKKTWVKRSTDWEGAKQLLKGAYLTFIKHPYIVHLPHLKSLINCCQNIILSDGLHSNTQVSTSNLFHGFSNPQTQTGVLVSQSASAIPQQTGSEKQSVNALNVGTSHYAPGASLSPSGMNSAYNNSAPSTAYSTSNQQIPSFAAVTAAATLAERLAGNNNANPVTSQGFNSVTIRLIAMQLLQTGDSQTLESFIGNSMNAPEKLESLLLNLIYPMCIRVCSGAREAPKLRICDIMFTLNVVLNMLAPQSSSSKSCTTANSSPKTATDTSQFILSKITTTIGSTQTGATALGIVGSSSHSATNNHQQAQPQDSLKIGFLGLKILCVCFETQLASEWIRISRVIRDLALQTGQPSGPLWDFLDFVATYRFPLYILLVPMIKCDLAKKVRNEKLKDNSAHNLQCLKMIESKLHGVAPTVCRSKSFLFVSLTAELRMLKEQLITKRRLLLEGDRQISSSHLTPQAGNPGGPGSLSPNQHGQYNDGSSQGDHFTAYHRLSAAIASFANQSAQGKITSSASGSNNQQTGTSAALKGTCFAAQLATSAPIGPQMSDNPAVGGNSRGSADYRNETSQNSIRLSTAKSREEARKVMNTILRRTSYPHNQTLLRPEEVASSSGERKNSQPSSPSSTVNRQPTADVESGVSNQIIMDPAMLMAAFPAPRKSTIEGSGILKQLIQSIDRQNQKQQQQQKQQTSGHIHE